MDSKYAERGVRLSKIRELFCDGKNIEFANRVGVSEQNASSYCNGKTAIGDKLLERVLEAFPRISRTWLYLGEGDLLRPESSSLSDSGSVTGAVMNHQTLSSESTNDVDRLITIIENKDRQMERLIRMLEYKISKDDIE